MIIDDTIIQEYPFEGEFYEMYKDTSLPPSQRVEQMRVILTTECDIQEAQKSDNNSSTHTKYNVYFPFDKESGVTVRRGMMFKGEMYGVNVEGKVIGIFPTQLGGCACYIGDSGK